MIFLKRSLARICTLMILHSALLTIKVSAQPPYPDVADLRVIGNSATFFFKTIDQFRDGVTLNDWTTIRIRYKYEDQINWQLLVWADSDSIENIEGGNSIPLTNFSLQITTPVSFNNTNENHIATSFIPSKLAAPLIWGSVIDKDSIGTVEFKISYTLSPNDIGNLPSGTYFVPLRLRLQDAP